MCQLHIGICPAYREMSERKEFSVNVAVMSMLIIGSQQELLGNAFPANSAIEI